MKTITIDFTAQAVVSDYALGRIGEHNATQLTITPPDALTLEPRTATYRVQFRTGSEVVTSESFTTVPFTIPLWHQLTEHSRLSLQIIAYDADGEYIGKSEKLSGFYFDASVGGTPADTDSDAHSLEAEVGANTAARHTHANKDTLDDIPAPTSADIGKALTAGADGLEWGEVAGNGAVEIYDSGTTAKYTATELSYMADQDAHFCYHGHPVINYGYQLVPREFYFTYIETKASVGMNVLVYYAKCKVNDSKVITIGTQTVVPKTVNNVSADTNGNITIPTSEQVQADWDEADTTAVDYIKNKPDLSVYALSSSLATVATSGDYDDLINKPVIPPSWVASPTAPLDTSLLWIDTSDNTVEDLADADNTEY